MKDVNIVIESYGRIIEKIDKCKAILLQHERGELCYDEMAYRIRKINKEIKETVGYINTKTKFVHYSL